MTRRSVYIVFERLFRLNKPGMERIWGEYGRDMEHEKTAKTPRRYLTGTCVFPSQRHLRHLQNQPPAHEGGLSWVDAKAHQQFHHPAAPHCIQCSLHPPGHSRFFESEEGKRAFAEWKGQRKRSRWASVNVKYMDDGAGLLTAAAAEIRRKGRRLPSLLSRAQ